MRISNPSTLRLEPLDGERALAPVLVPTLRPREVQGVADLQRVHVLRHLAALGEALVGEVDLDDEVHVPFVHVRRRRRVRAPLLLPVLVRVGQRDVLADGKAEDVLGGL